MFRRNKSECFVSTLQFFYLNRKNLNTIKLNLVHALQGSKRKFTQSKLSISAQSIRYRRGISIYIDTFKKVCWQIFGQNSKRYARFYCNSQHNRGITKLNNFLPSFFYYIKQKILYTEIYIHG